MKHVFTCRILLVCLSILRAEVFEPEAAEDEIILDSPRLTRRSNVILEEDVDILHQLYEKLENIIGPVKDTLDRLFDEIPKRKSFRKNTSQSKIERGDEMEGPHINKPNIKITGKRLKPKVIRHPSRPSSTESSKNESLKSESQTDVTGEKRMLNPFLENMKRLCKRQFTPMCTGLFSFPRCNGPDCMPPGGSGLGGCIPGMPNCIVSPFNPASLSQASGILFLPKDCTPGSSNCNTGNNPPAPPTPPTPPPITRSSPIFNPNLSDGIALPPATVELKLSPSFGSPNAQCCQSDCKDVDQCLILGGKKYRLVPYEETGCVGSQCSDFVDPYSAPSSIRAVPVPEDCISTLKDMDFSSSTLKHAPTCQKATIRVVVNLGRSLGQLIRATNQIYNVGGCSLSPRDTKMISRASHQLLLNGCCSPTGGNIIKIGGGCKK